MAKLSSIYGNTVSNLITATNEATITNKTFNDPLVTGDLKVNTTQLVVDITTGNIGINNDTPVHELDVTGDINFTGTLYKNGVEFTGSGGTNNDLSIAYSIIFGV